MLSEEAMTCKFHECGMPEFLKGCQQRRAGRDPNVVTDPPFTSVVHKREHGIRFTTEGDRLAALIFYFKGPDGEDRESIREFVCPRDGETYRLLTVATFDL
jgi:hypothetical protein